MSQYYDGTKLLSLKDVNGETPDLYLCTTNRTGGKTTYFNRLAVNRFLNKKIRKFCLFYRYNYELSDVADKFFKDIQALFFPNHGMSSKVKAKGVYTELSLYNKIAPDILIPCGYALALNNADILKKYSHLFNDVDMIIFDEFQSESNHYCPDEIKKFISLYTSINRGQGEAVRHVPVYMLSNQVSLINPYYVALGISSRLNSSTKFLKGDGYVLESGFIEHASKAQQSSGINKAFKDENYVKFSSQNVYLNDNASFIDEPKNERGRYLCTVKYENILYGVLEYPASGIVYVSNKADLTFPLKISVTLNDHDVNYVMLKKNEILISTLRYYFEHGCFRFKDLKCKEALLKTITY